MKKIKVDLNKELDFVEVDTSVGKLFLYELTIGNLMNIESDWDDMDKNVDANLYMKLFFKYTCSNKCISIKKVNEKRPLTKSIVSRLTTKDLNKLSDVYISNYNYFNIGESISRDELELKYPKAEGEESYKYLHRIINKENENFSELLKLQRKNIKSITPEILDYLVSTKKGMDIQNKLQKSVEALSINQSPNMKELYNETMHNITHFKHEMPLPQHMVVKRPEAELLEKVLSEQIKQNKTLCQSAQSLFNSNEKQDKIFNLLNVNFDKSSKSQEKNFKMNCAIFFLTFISLLYSVIVGISSIESTKRLNETLNTLNKTISTVNYNGRNNNISETNIDSNIRNIVVADTTKTIADSTDNNIKINKK